MKICVEVEGELILVTSEREVCWSYILGLSLQNE